MIDKEAINPVEDLTVDELAARVGITVRMVRSYTARGLLPPPRLRGRTGLYGREHIARLSALRDMLDAGYTLAAAERVLAAAPTGLTAHGLDIYRAMLNPGTTEDSEIVDPATLAARVGIDLDQQRISQLEELGVAQQLTDGRLQLTSPSLLRAALQISALGVPMDDVLDTQQVLHEHAQAMAQECVDLFRGTVWQSFHGAGRPDDQWPTVRGALERALPVASQAVLLTFRLALTDAITQAIAEATAGPEDPPPQP